MELIDIGCNLTHDSFDKDRAEVIANALAQAQGKRRIVLAKTRRREGRNSKGSSLAPSRLRESKSYQNLERRISAWN